VRGDVERDEVLVAMMCCGREDVVTDNGEMWFVVCQIVMFGAN
jgi:hypothetical protein